MTRRLRWWWWAAVVLTGITLLSLAASFMWIFGWSDSNVRYYLYLEHGMLCLNPNAAVSIKTVNLPWYGLFEVYHSACYEPWTALPQFQYWTAGQWACKVPIHFLLLVSIPIVAYPILPSTIRRDRRKRGLCLRCGYDLTGNVSGVCSECGEAVPGSDV